MCWTGLARALGGGFETRCGLGFVQPCYSFSMPLPLVHPIKLTYEDYLGFPEDGRRHEILDGEHIVTPAPSRRHQSVCRWILHYLAAWTVDHGGEVFAAPFDVVLSPTDIVQPDVLYISPERSSILTDANAQGAPDLVIEILSESTRRRDEVTKRHLYARHGVIEYWIVDPVLETVKIYRDPAAGFAESTTLARESGDHLESPLLARLRLAIDRIFA